MSTLNELVKVTESIRHLVLMRWTNSDILDHVVVKLPAPIFDKMYEELKSETINPFREDKHYIGGRGSHLMFNGIKFERIDGRYWSVNVANPIDSKTKSPPYEA